MAQKQNRRWVEAAVAAGGLPAGAQSVRRSFLVLRVVVAGGDSGVGLSEVARASALARSKAYKAFVDSGWSADASAGATAKAGDTGAQVAGAVRLADDVYVYQFSENGLIAEATVAGSKYSKDDELNTKK